jgi:hypothetical protein
MCNLKFCHAEDPHGHRSLLETRKNREGIIGCHHPCTPQTFGQLGVAVLIVFKLVVIALERLKRLGCLDQNALVWRGKK